MLTASQVATLAAQIANRFGLNQCKECATALRCTFAASGLHGRVLRLSTVGGRPFIVMRSAAFRLPFSVPPGVDAISSNGQHFGVQVGQQVFDNVFRSGVAAVQWQSMFDCSSHQFLVITETTF